MGGPGGNRTAASPRTNRAEVRAGFSLIELLVVISIIVVLLSILLPSLTRARAAAASVKCRANLQQIGVGLVLYSNQNHDFVVPSYNLPWAPGASTNFTGSPEQPLEGWVSILDREQCVISREKDRNTTFYCPKTVDVEGMAGGQTGEARDNPRGWTDWPLIFESAGGDSMPKTAVTIPERRYNKIIRVSYWINAYNPVGNQPADIEASDLYYTASVGLGPDSRGRFVRLRKQTCYRPERFIVVSDGLYMGRQSVTRQGDKNSRIGYRHPSMNDLEGSANIALADGHAESITGDRFPRAVGSRDSGELIEEKRMENLRGPTVYADPRQVFP